MFRGARQVVPPLSMPVEACRAAVATSLDDDTKGLFAAALGKRLGRAITVTVERRPTIRDSHIGAILKRAAAAKGANRFRLIDALAQLRAQYETRLDVLRRDIRDANEVAARQQQELAAAESGAEELIIKRDRLQHLEEMHAAHERDKAEHQVCVGQMMDTRRRAD